MSFENPQNIIRSWNLQSNFATGPVVADKLTPPQYGRIRTNFVNTWREEKVDSRLDWGVSNFSVYLPESLRVVASIYLRVSLLANLHASLSNNAPVKVHLCLHLLLGSAVLHHSQVAYQIATPPLSST